jgi:hypothetical protein
MRPTSVSRSRAIVACVFLLTTTLASAVAGCGHIEYRARGARRQRIASAVNVSAVHVSAGPASPGYVVMPGPASTPRVAVYPAPPPGPPMMPPGPPPRAHAFAPPPPPAPTAGGEVECSGNQRLRIHNQVVDGRGGPAVVASGNCVIELSESIVRGSPALIASGNAQVLFVESRIIGDVRATGNARIDQRGSTHRGSTLRGPMLRGQMLRAY